MHTFLVAFDGSAHAFRAIEKTLALMDAKQMHIRLLNVQEPVRTNETPRKPSSTPPRSRNVT
ncbi:MAG TPA: universal stress protein [Burkholderiales bacterium]|nr:universal stress protein [Burkholderiales bacterium]